MLDLSSKNLPHHKSSNDAKSATFCIITIFGGYLLIQLYIFVGITNGC